MRKFSRRGKATLAVAIVSVVAVNAGAAWAYWRLSGSGTVSGTAGSVVALEASGALTGGAKLYPGVRRNITVTVKNNNPFRVKITQIKRGATPVVVDVAHAAAGCVNSGVQLYSNSFTMSRSLPANSTTSFEMSKALTMTTASDNACQGATFVVPMLVFGVAESA